jgi:DNA (cytosine-5)-methyltransferase 1
MAAYYNEIDPYAASWLRELIEWGHIAPGDVDERSIADVRPSDLAGYRQCHFFAGIGGWSFALRMAGWEDAREVWTGSCPCQPYSPASLANGGAKGQGDERHLWPRWLPLIRECRPARVFGEQVASAISWGWWDEVALDLEAEGYACASAVLRADAVGARHERKRLYWMADSGRPGRQGFEPNHGLSVAAKKALTVDGHGLARGGRALDGDHHFLLPGDGLSVAVERCATKGYGNAIVPHVAAAFIQAAD